MPAAPAQRWGRRKAAARIVAMLGVTALMLYLALAPDEPAPRITPVTTTQADELRAVISRPALPVVFDTDVVNNIDDTLALTMLLGYQSRQMVKLLAVTASYRDDAVTAYLDAIDSWLGAGDIPVGVVQQGGVGSGGDLFHRQVAAAFPHRTSDQPAVAQLRRALAGQADRSAVVIATGYATNLAQLLESGPDAASPLSGRELVKTKVKLLAATAGDFRQDIPSARLVFDTWPTPIAANQWQLGASLPFPGQAVASLGPHNPVVMAMTAYGQNALGVPFPYNPPATDPATVLYAVEPDRYLKAGEAGRISLDAQGVAHFSPDPQGQHRLILRPADPTEVTDRFSDLVQVDHRQGG